MTIARCTNCGRPAPVDIDVELRKFVAEWWEKYGSCPSSPRELLELAEWMGVFDGRYTGMTHHARVISFSLRVLRRLTEQTIAGLVVREHGSGNNTLYALYEALDDDSLEQGDTYDTAISDEA